METYVDFIKAKERDEIVNEILDLKVQPQSNQNKLRIQKLQQRLGELV
jgi:hypothetical protein